METIPGGITVPINIHIGVLWGGDLDGLLPDVVKSSGFVGDASASYAAGPGAKQSNTYSL